MTTRTFLTTLLAAGAVAALGPGVAGAETICVHAPAGQTCDTTQSDLQAALDTAESNPGADTIALGDPGFPQEGPFVYPHKALILDPVTIKGVGASRPVLTTPAGEAALSVNKATVEGIDIHLPNSTDALGIGAINSTLRDIRITGPGPHALGAVGVKALSGTAIDNVEVTGTGGFGLWVDLGATGVEASDLRTSNVTEGVDVFDGGGARVTQSKISATDLAFGDRGTAAVDSSVLETTAAKATGVTAGDGNIALDHVSVVHRGPVDGTDEAFDLHPVDFGGKADLRSVVIAGYTRGFRRDTTEGNFPYPITIRDSVWDPAHDVFIAAPNASVTESNNAHVDPRLVDPANGDYRLRGSSPAVDRDTKTDPDYKDIDGNGVVNNLADAGALEYRRLAPKVDSANVPASGATGEALAFAATASDPDGDNVQFAWEFGDGEIVAGANATHAYKAPGIYTVKLHVTDEVNLEATRTFSVAVSGALASSAGDGTSGSSGGVTDLIAPKLTKVRLSKDRRKVLFTVSERAKMRVTVRGRTIVKTVTAGRRSIRIGRLLHARHARVKVAAIDAAGNRSAVRIIRA